MTERLKLEDRLAFLRLGPEDIRRLGGLRETLAAHAPGLVGAFYRHLLSFDTPASFLRSAEVAERLKDKQRDYLISLAGPALDDGFLAERRKIGDTHERIGLEPFWYLASFALYISLLTPVVRQKVADAREADLTLDSLAKLLVFDATVAMEAYIDRRERDLAEANRELEARGRVLERDVDRTQEQLRATAERARAAEALAAMGTLAAGLAHEIGTPMGVIQGHAKLLETERDPERARWRARTIREQVERINRIVRALQDMTRPRAPVRRPVELLPLVERCLSFLEQRLEERRISLETQLAHVPPVLGDADRLQQLLLNLLFNAIDAMPRGGRLSVRLEREGDARVRVRVADTGSGIDQHDLPKIFEPFFTTKPAGEGSGLGLAVARGTVLEHGGTIDVRSDPALGTEFEINLPAQTG